MTTNVMSSHFDAVKEYSIQQYMITCVSDLRLVGGFYRVFWFPPAVKLTPHGIAKILLKVALSTLAITLTHSFNIFIKH